MSLPQLCVTQLGARRHYAVPKILNQAGMLEHFYTDICAVKGWPRIFKGVPKSFQPSGLKQLLARVPKEIPLEHITCFTSLGWEYARRRKAAQSFSESIATSLWAGNRFCNLILEHDIGNATGVYTFNSAGLELLQFAKTQGLLTIMEQTVAPMEILRKYREQEEAKFPNWELPTEYTTSFFDFVHREKEEWAYSDMIICGSEFVREGIAECGGPVERCVVVPYGVDVHFSVEKRPQHNDPLRVLTVGGIGLRKGSPYVLAAAKMLKGRAQFRMVGSLDVKKTAINELQSHIDVVGSVPRSEILKHYAWADVFLLPSLCEGSAVVTYEAMSCGLPVIATPNTGTIVCDGENGFIVPVCSPEAIVEKLEKLAAEPELLHIMSENAQASHSQYSLDSYQNRLIETLKNIY